MKAFKRKKKKTALHRSKRECCQDCQETKLERERKKTEVYRVLNLKSSIIKFVFSELKSMN